MAAEKTVPGIYLETDAKSKIAVRVVREDGSQERFSPATPAEDLLACMDVDYAAYRRKVKSLWEEHPLFEERSVVPVSDYQDFVAEVRKVSDLLKDIDPLSHLVVEAKLQAALTIPDDGTAVFLLNNGKRLLNILEEPLLTQIRLRNIFEVAFDGMERATQRERYEQLRKAYPQVTNCRFLSKWKETPDSTVPLGGQLEYTVWSLFALRCLELTLYFRQEAQRIVRCEHCWNYFIPKTKKETLYCDRTFDGKTCKQLGPNLKRKEGPELDEALKCYNELRSRMSARLERYENAGAWEREQLIQTSAADYDEWISVAHQARTDYLNGKLTSEQFLRTIDFRHEMESYAAAVLQPPDPHDTAWRRHVVRNIDFDPATRFVDMISLNLSEGSDAQWKMISAEEQIKAAWEGYESLREKYKKD